MFVKEKIVFFNANVLWIPGNQYNIMDMKDTQYTVQDIQ